MLRALILVGVLTLGLTAPAQAGVVDLSLGGRIAYLTFDDPAGAADDIRVVSSAEETITLLGPTVAAGSGCLPVAGGASCTRPASSVAWERTDIVLGGGDDAVVVEAPQAIRVYGGDGNDRIAFAATAVGSIYGMAGDDVLAAAASARIEGGPGNDRLSAGAGSGLSGGAGTDRLDGSPQDDVLVDAGDRGARDVIGCNGGADVTQGDATDALVGCTRAALDRISRLKYFWRVRFGPRLSVPTRMRVGYTDYYGLQSAFARCLGAPCHGARFDGRPRDRVTPLRIVSGGRRIRIDGRWWRGVSPGAIVRAGLEFRFGDVRFTKGLEFRTRARKLPTVRKRCTVAVIKPPRTTGPGRAVPCT